MWSLLDFRQLALLLPAGLLSETTDTESLRHSCLVLRAAGELAVGNFRFYRNPRPEILN